MPTIDPLLARGYCGISDGKACTSPRPSSGWETAHKSKTCSPRSLAKRFDEYALKYFDLEISIAEDLSLSLHILNMCISSHRPRKKVSRWFSTEQIRDHSTSTPSLYEPLKACSGRSSGGTGSSHGQCAACRARRGSARDRGRNRRGGSCRTCSLLVSHTASVQYFRVTHLRWSVYQ